MLDRTEINRALAKAIAYKQCGKDEKARVWAARLVIFLEEGGILRDGIAQDAMRFQPEA